MDLKLSVSALALENWPQIDHLVVLFQRQTYSIHRASNSLITEKTDLNPSHKLHAQQIRFLVLLFFFSFFWCQQVFWRLLQRQEMFGGNVASLLTVLFNIQNIRLCSFFHSVCDISLLTRIEKMRAKKLVSPFSENRKCLHFVLQRWHILFHSQIYSISFPQEIRRCLSEWLASIVSIWVVISINV